MHSLKGRLDRLERKHAEPDSVGVYIVAGPYSMTGDEVLAALDVAPADTAFVMNLWEADTPELLA